MGVLHIDGFHCILNSSIKYIFINSNIFFQILRCLNKTYQNMKLKPVWQDINPKAVTTDELYGVINRATREWKDGLFSTIMRDISNISHDGPKWIVLDGDIDPMWIESLNTVMDDNKVYVMWQSCDYETLIL